MQHGGRGMCVLMLAKCTDLTIQQSGRNVCSCIRFAQSVQASDRFARQGHTDRDEHGI